MSERSRLLHRTAGTRSLIAELSAQPSQGAALCLSHSGGRQAEFVGHFGRRSPEYRRVPEGVPGLRLDGRAYLVEGPNSCGALPSRSPFAIRHS